MIRVFIDASVLFSAALSATGASREILLRGIRREVELLASDLVLEEVRRNLVAKCPDRLHDLDDLLEAMTLHIVNPHRRQVIAAASYTELKDAPIVAAAQQARADFLVSLDRAHLVDVPAVATRSGLRIMLPSTLLMLLRADSPST